MVVFLRQIFQQLLDLFLENNLVYHHHLLLQYQLVKIFHLKKRKMMMTKVMEV
jgi:hypothetical protein